MGTAKEAGPRAPISWGLLIVGLLLTATLTVVVVRQDRQSAQHAFGVQAERHAASLRRSVSLVDHSISALDGLFAASQQVSREEFQRFASRLIENAPELRALEWLPRVEGHELDAWAAAIRAGGEPDFYLRGWPPGAARRDDDGPAFPVRYLTPTTGNIGVLGFDLRSEPNRRAAIDEACHTGQRLASEPVSLLQNQGETLDGVLVFSPRIDPDDGRCEGVLLAVLDLPRLLSASPGYNTPAVHAVLVRGAGAGRLQLPASRAGESEQPSASRLATSAVLSLPGLSFELQARPTAFFRAQHRPTLAIVVALAGFLITVLLVLGRRLSVSLEYELRGRSRELEDRVAARTVELEKTRATARELERQRLEGLGLLAGGVAHDFNNLLTAILGHVSRAEGLVDATSPAAASLVEATAASERAAELVDQLLAYAGGGAADKEPIDLADLGERMMRLLSASTNKKVLLDWNLRLVPPVLGQPTQLRQVLLNLVTNAAEALGDDGGRVEILVRLVAHRPSNEPEPSWVEGRPTPGAEYVELSVRDDGPGMPAGVRARVFEPFFTTKATGRGLGMAAMAGIARSHGAFLGLDSVEGEGTEVSLWFPVAKGVTAEPETDRQSYVVDEPTTGRVLIVDDEPAVRKLVAAVLETAGCTVQVAEDGLKGLEAVRANPDGFDLLLVDMMMPGLNGIEVIRAVRELRPNLPILLSTGYAGDLQYELADLPGPTDLLPKPYRAATLTLAVRSALSGTGRN